MFVFFTNFQAEGETEVNNELANRISLFYADATPMLKALSDGTTKFVSEVRLSADFFNSCMKAFAYCVLPLTEQEFAY